MNAPRRLASIGALLLALAVSQASDTKTAKKDELTPEESKTARTLFDKYDLDKDGFLDKAELAKFFRGPSAKPPPDPKKEDKPTDSKKDDSQSSQTPSKPKEPKPPPKLLPDQEFLDEWDTNGDEKISIGEFEKAYLEYLKELQELQSKQTMQQHYGSGGGHGKKKAAAKPPPPPMPPPKKP